MFKNYFLFLFLLTKIDNLIQSIKTKHFTHFVELNKFKVCGHGFWEDVITNYSKEVLWN